MEAAGLIIFRKLEGAVQYLLLQTSYGKHHWTPPKGFVDPGESAIQAAIRETQEESGLTSNHYQILENSKYVDSYFDPSKKAEKTVHYWLARILDPNSPVKLSREHQAYRWCSMEEGCDISGFDSFRKMMGSVHKFAVDS